MALPGRTITAIRQKVGKMREGKQGKTWTPEKYEMFKSHPNAYYGVSPAELQIAFPGFTLAAIYTQLRDWRKLHGLKPADFKQAKPFLKQDFNRFMAHPTKLYGCTPDELREFFPNRTLNQIIQQLRYWRRTQNLRCPAHIKNSSNFTEEEVAKIRNHNTLYFGEHNCRE